MRWRTALVVTRDLPHYRVRLTCASSHSLAPLTPRKNIFVVEKRVELTWKYHLDPAALVPPGKINSKKTAHIGTEDLSLCRIRSMCDSSYSWVSLTARKAVYVVKSGSTDDLDQVAHNWAFGAPSHDFYILRQKRLTLSLGYLDGTSWRCTNVFRAPFRTEKWTKHRVNDDPWDLDNLVNIGSFEHEMRWSFFWWHTSYKRCPMIDLKSHRDIVQTYVDRGFIPEDRPNAA